MTDKNFAEIEKFLTELGVRTRDCDFETLRQCVQDSIKNGKGAFETPAPQYWQENKIEEAIVPHSSVLDIGCGDGLLLARLAERCRSQVQGIEISQENAIRCIERGIPTFHGDVEEVIHEFSDNSFDYAVMQNTLQTLKRPIEVLNEMLRVANQAFVSFPNFAHWQIRLAFSLGGRMPINANLPSTWYNTQNIHLCSINDFMDWTDAEHLRIVKAWAVANGEVIEYRKEHNLIAENALFMVERAQ